MSIYGFNYLGSEKSGLGVKVFQAEAAATNEVLEGAFKEATSAEIDKAVMKASKAFPLYKSKSAEERANFLDAIAEEILNLGDELIQRAMLESGLPQGRLTGERGRTMNQLKLFAKVVREGSWIDARIDPAMPDREPNPRVDIRQMHIPLGPVGIFGASNFPLAFSVAGGDTASALAAGCPVVVKGHPLHPGTSELVASAIVNAAEKTDMPDGVFSLVQGQSIEVGMGIVQHPLIKAIGFTGSYRGGKAIFDAANQRREPIPVFAEMGSTNPVFILPEALRNNLDTLPSGICNSLNLGVGQFCTNPGVIIAQESESLEKLKAGLQTSIAAVGPGTMLGTGIKTNYINGVSKLEASENVEKLIGNENPETGNQALPQVFTTDAESFVSNKHLEEEVFGPAMLLVKSNNKNDLLEIANGLSGHLTASIFGTESELSEYGDLIDVLQSKVGRIIFNGYPTGVEVGHAMVHGGPFPATTAQQTTSVGTAAIKRFARPFCYQNFPQERLPKELQDGNPMNIWRLIDGDLSKD